MVDKTKVSLRSETVLTSAYVATSNHEIGGTSFVSIFAKYTRGAAGGRAAIKIQGSFDGTTWHDMVVVDPSTLTAGVVDSDVMVVKLPAPADASPAYYVVGQDVSGFKYLRLMATESGVPGTPGTLSLDAVLSNG